MNTKRRWIATADHAKGGREVQRSSLRLRADAHERLGPARRDIGERANPESRGGISPEEGATPAAATTTATACASATAGVRFPAVLRFEPEHPVRLLPLDGALLAFDRRDGRRWLVRADATRGLRAQAPALVLFSITNACNLACSFCYRDQSAASAWTVDSAYDLLASLAARGTLEVAFGGGEPFAFKGFCALVERLSETTPLVVHATTNGRLVTPAVARRLRGRVGELRLSVYDDVPWRDVFALLRDEGHSVGLHWLVTPARLPTLRAFAESLCELGARRLFLLSYNGPDGALHLSPAQARTLASTVEALRALPLEVGVSACWGDRLDALPRISPERGDDCGAGDHFVSIGPSGALSPCSFHHQRRVVQTASDVLDAWREARGAGPARVEGCHRLPLRPPRERPRGLWRWRAWSGNNSVDCFTVGRFATARVADAAVAELRALTAKPPPSLMDQANAAVTLALDELSAAAQDRREFARVWVSEQEGLDRWLGEVRAWPQGPGAVERYARALGADPRPGELPASVEVPDVLVSFGATAVWVQGKTLRPFRALDALWVYRGARVYAFDAHRSRELALVWAARCESDDAARQLAAKLDGVARESSVWGVVDMRASVPRPDGLGWTSRVEAVRRALEDRGLRFDGVAIADAGFTTEALRRAVATLRRAPAAVPERLRFIAPELRGDALEAALRALDADPSGLFAWVQARMEGSRRWPRDLALHRWDHDFLLEAEHLPAALGRGLLLRGAATPHALEAREVRVSITLHHEDPALAHKALASVGLEPGGASTASVVTTAPAPIIARAGALATRRGLGWRYDLMPASPRLAALEALQSRLKIRFRAR